MTGASETVRYPQDEPLRQASWANSSVPRFSKVPEVTLGFWIIKILATTLGETGGDAVTMSMNLGYAIGTLIFLAIFLAAVAVQIRREDFQRLCLLADHRRNDDRRDDDRRLCRPFAGDRIFRWLDSAPRLRDDFACGLAMVGRHDLGQHDRHAKDGNVLLGDDPVFADAWHSAGRLGRRHERPRLWRRRYPVRWGAGWRSGALRLHEGIAGHAVLGRLHSHPAARSDARRSARQAHKPWRLCN